jgi:hypothetical protein
MSEAYARGGQEQARVGGIIIAISSVLAAFLVIAGLIYAAGTGQRHQAALAAAGCEPGLSASGLQCTTVQALTSQYTAIATPAARQLSSYETAYTTNERHHLATAETALTAEVTEENAFDTSLAGITFPPAIAPIATALIRADQARAKLVTQQARSTSLKQLRSFNHQVQVATDAVQTEMNLLLKALKSPPQTG